jgi:hypothetical protein
MERQPARRDLKHATGKRKDGKGSHLDWLVVRRQYKYLGTVLKCYNNRGEKGMWRLHLAGIRRVSGGTKRSPGAAGKAEVYSSYVLSIEALCAD